MTLVKKKPWSQFFADPFFSDLVSTEKELKEAFPAINIVENDKNFEVELAVPGFDKDDFNIEIDNNRLMVSAESKKEDEKKEKDYRQKEFSYASFQRSFLIPDNVDEKKVDASYKDGILHIFFQKMNESPSEKKRSINIK